MRHISTKNVALSRPVVQTAQQRASQSSLSDSRTLKVVANYCRDELTLAFRSVSQWPFSLHWREIGNVYYTIDGSKWPPVAPTSPRVPYPCGHFQEGRDDGNRNRYQQARVMSAPRPRFRVRPSISRFARDPVHAEDWPAAFSPSLTTAGQITLDTGTPLVPDTDPGNPYTGIEWLTTGKWIPVDTCVTDLSNRSN